jgi:hypothetical protein
VILFNGIYDPSKCVRFRTKKWTRQTRTDLDIAKWPLGAVGKFQTDPQDVSSHSNRSVFQDPNGTVSRSQETGLGIKMYIVAFQDLARSKILTSLLKSQPLRIQLPQPATLGKDIPTTILYEPVTFFRHKPYCVKIHSLSLRLLSLVDIHRRFQHSSPPLLLL